MLPVCLPPALSICPRLNLLFRPVTVCGHKQGSFIYVSLGQWCGSWRSPSHLSMNGLSMLLAQPQGTEYSRFSEGFFVLEWNTSCVSQQLEPLLPPICVFRQVGCLWDKKKYSEIGITWGKKWFGKYILFKMIKLISNSTQLTPHNTARVCLTKSPISIPMSGNVENPIIARI